MAIKDVHVVDFHRQEDINLRAQYPISHRVVIKRTLPSLIALCLFLVALGVEWEFAGILGQNGMINDAFRMLTLLGLAVSAAVFGIRLIYEELHRACYSYRIEGGHFAISKGIILKQRGSFPLSRITDVYVDYTFADFILRLCSIHLSTPTQHSGEFARIDGLAYRTAIELQDHLTKLLESRQTLEDAAAYPSNHSAQAKIVRQKANGGIVINHSQPEETHLHFTPEQAVNQ